MLAGIALRKKQGLLVLGCPHAGMLHSAHACLLLHATVQELIPPQETAMSKYSRDLTQLARQGGLDPVVGRSDEIRR